ncbi:MAG: DUF4395 domain-containing protein [Pseudomonadota bacterium]
MTTFSFGEDVAGVGYKVLDERVMRGSAGIMLALAIVASINGFVLKNYWALPYISGFLVVNFLIGLLVNPSFSPTVFIARLLVHKQTPLYIGAVQKKFAWTLGLVLSTTILFLSLRLLSDASWFNNVCRLCLICILLLYLETAFGICVGCKLYPLAIRLKLMKEPEIRPNCMGDSCRVDVP